MDKVAMIKQAYAYGAAVALQELGYDVNTAQNAGVKLAEDEEGMHPALRALIGTGAGIGGGALLGAGLGAGGAALAHKLRTPMPSNAEGYLTHLMTADKPGMVGKALDRFAVGPKSVMRNPMPDVAGEAMKREALLGANLGGAGLGALGGLGGGLYGGLSE